MVKWGMKRLVLRYQGMFDFEGLYEEIVKFFTSRHYHYVEGRWKEKNFSPLGRERVIKMSPEKNVTEYLKYIYSIEWNNMDVHEVEVVRNGKTVSLTWARFELTCNAFLEIDWQGLGKGHPKTAKFFNEKVLKKELTDVHGGNLIMEEQRLIDDIKRFLHMEVTRTDK